MLPVALARVEDAFRADDAADTESLAFLGVAAGAIGVLVAVHGSLNSLWWLPAVICAAAGALFSV